MRAILIFSLTLISFAGFTQCEETFNMFNWSKKGNPESEWSVLSQNEVKLVSEDVIPPTFYVSQKSIINAKISGMVKVEGTDNDCFGFVFGYEKPSNAVSVNNYYNYYLFNWRKEDMTWFHNIEAYEGITLIKANKFIYGDEYWKYFFEFPDIPGQYDILDLKYGENLGWETNHWYNFELIYTNQRLVVIADDDTLLDRPYYYEKGKFGFYVFSQKDVIFKDFGFEFEMDFQIDEDCKCPGEAFNFYLTDPYQGVIPNNLRDWKWIFDDGTESAELNPKHIFNESGTHEVKLVAYSNQDCIDTTVRNVKVYKKPDFYLVKDTLVKYGDTVRLSISDNYAYYLWSNGSFSHYTEIKNLTNDTIIGVTVRNNKGCETYKEIFIKVSDPPESRIYVPNAFTPNGDGLNDEFKPVLENIAHFKMWIYDRWGKLVFETSDPDNGWKAKNYNAGVYVYKIIYEGYDHPAHIKNPQQLNGTFMLIK